MAASPCFSLPLAPLSSMATTEPCSSLSFPAAKVMERARMPVGRTGARFLSAIPACADLPAPFVLGSVFFVLAPSSAAALDAEVESSQQTSGFAQEGFFSAASRYETGSRDIMTCRSSVPVFSSNFHVAPRGSVYDWSNFILLLDSPVYGKIRHFFPS